MSKKKPKEMARHREKFMAGAEANGIDPEKADKIFGLMAEFASYGFPKAHSTAYALITYQTAYLKANHPREYLSALLSVEAGNHDKLARYIAHAREQKIDILPPDVNESERDFTPVAGGIRFGLAGVKNVGEGAIESILSVRAEGGTFKTLLDFACRIDGRKVNRRVVESLVKCGAFDSIDESRAKLWAGLNVALESGAAVQRDREIGQVSLFGDVADGGPVLPEIPDAAPWTEQERLGYEKEVLGFYVTGHPLEAFVPALARFSDTTAAAASEKLGREVRIGGLITSLRETRTRRGKTMAFGTLEDLEGSFELVIFAKDFERLRGVLKKAMAANSEGRRTIPLLVSGTLESLDPPKVLVRDAFELRDAESNLAARVRIRVAVSEATRDRMLALRRLLEAHAGDCAVLLHVLIPGESETIVSVAGGRGVEPSEEMLVAVNGLFGRPVAEVDL
jgi:DNA polymerase-3 subunit alpha